MATAMVSSDVVHGMSMLWVRKMLTFFQMYDVDRKGVISRERMKEVFLERAKNVLPEAQLAEMDGASQRDWHHFYGRASITVGGICRVSWADFIMDRFHAVKHNRAEEERNLRELITIMFDMIDFNKDNIASLEELEKAQLLFGLSKHSARVRMAAMDTACSGQVSHDLWFDNCLQFFYSTEWDDGAMMLGTLSQDPIEVINENSIAYVAPVPRAILDEMSELWVRKMLTFFRDVDEEGVGSFSPADMQAVDRRRVRHRQSTQQQKDRAANLGEIAWKALWGPASETVDGQTAITWPSFLASRYRGATVDKEKDEQLLTDMHVTIMKTLGLTNDTHFTLEEYIDAMSSTGLSKHSLAIAYINMDEDGDGKISRDEAKKTWLRFFYSKEFDTGTLAYGPLNSARLEASSD